MSYEYRVCPMEGAQIGAKVQDYCSDSQKASIRIAQTEPNVRDHGEKLHGVSTKSNQAKRGNPYYMKRYPFWQLGIAATRVFVTSRSLL